MQVAHALREAREVKQQRRRDAVGQVADDPHAGREAGEVVFERIGAVHDQVRRRKLGGEPGSQIAVELNDFKMPDQLQ